MKKVTALTIVGFFGYWGNTMMPVAVAGTWAEGTVTANVVQVISAPEPGTQPINDNLPDPVMVDTENGPALMYILEAR